MKKHFWIFATLLILAMAIPGVQASNTPDKKFRLELKELRSGKEDPWQSTGLTDKQVKKVEVTIDDLSITRITVYFNTEGAKLLEKITERNIGKALAIFVDGELVSSPVVNEKIPGGTAVIAGNFTFEEAQKLARQINGGPSRVVRLAPTKAEYKKAASIGSADFLCQSSEGGVQDKILKYEFIKNTEKQGLIQTCFYGSNALVLLGEDTPNGKTVRAGVYSFSSAPKDWHKKNLEKKAHRFTSICEIQNTSMSDRVDYLCYNPTVAAGNTEGEEFSFRIEAKKKGSFHRACTVFFGGEKKKQCGAWKKS